MPGNTLHSVKCAHLSCAVKSFVSVKHVVHPTSYALMSHGHMTASHNTVVLLHLRVGALALRMHMALHHGLAHAINYLTLLCNTHTWSDANLPTAPPMGCMSTALASLRLCPWPNVEHVGFGACTTILHHQPSQPTIAARKSTTLADLSSVKSTCVRYNLAYG